MSASGARLGERCSDTRRSRWSEWFGVRDLLPVSQMSYVTLHGAQDMAFGGQNLAAAVVSDRPINRLPGTTVLDNRAAKIDARRSRTHP